MKPAATSICIFAAILAHGALLYGQDFIVAHTSNWQEKHLESYFQGVKRTALPSFDSDEVTARARKLHPDVQVGTKGEFETSAAFAKRKDAATKMNHRAAENRSRLIDSAKLAHEKRVISLRPAYDKASAKSRQTFEKLLYMYPAKAQAYNADTSTYPPFLKPSSDLGSNSYGFAELTMNTTPKPFSCTDLQLAKRIRALSDSGNLWIVMNVTKASVTISRESKTIDRGALEKAGEGLMKSAPEIAIVLLAEYFKPGSGRNAYISPKQVDQTKTIYGYRVSVKGTDGGYAGLYDSQTDRWIWRSN